MPQRGPPKGTMPPNAGRGRKKGIPNKSTTELRAILAAFIEKRLPDIDRLWNQVAFGYQVDRAFGRSIRKIAVPGDPARALDLLQRLNEFVMPKLSRSEMVGDGGRPLIPPGTLTITFPEAAPGKMVEDEEDPPNGTPSSEAP